MFFWLTVPYNILYLKSEECTIMWQTTGRYYWVWVEYCKKWDEKISCMKDFMEGVIWSRIIKKKYLKISDTSRLSREKGYLINETTREERERIVKDSLGSIDASCDGCMAGLAEMYQDYIEGRKELREINMEFRAGYVKAEEMPERSGCDYM